MVAPEALDGVIEAEVAALLACAPGAAAEAKALIRRLATGPAATAVEDSIAALVERLENPEAAEGIAAFFGKRKPNWAV